uniref:Uncharacterized protein n=1 Tax=Anguilla anguilla TaxID=7936 RepID=A0A0E9W013_ANGAN
MVASAQKNLTGRAPEADR